MQSLKTLTRRAGIALVLTVPCVALATPPAWAPAHGWRKKNDPTYAGYSGREWDYDYGVRSGSCDRGRIGQVVGGVVGGTAGGAIGADVGRRMDKTDRSCVGHSLELADYGQSVKWTNPNTRVTYQLTPLDNERGGDGCRRFRLIAHGSFGLSEGRTVACTDGRGTWQLADDRYSRR